VCESDLRRPRRLVLTSEPAAVMGERPIGRPRADQRQPRAGATWVRMFSRTVSRCARDWHEMTGDSLYQFRPMSPEILAVMDRWAYDDYFPDFDMEAYHSSVRRGDDPPTGPAGCDGFGVYGRDGDLVGLFEYYFDDDGGASIGLALRPDLTNQRLGEGFLEAGVEYLVSNYDYRGDHVYLSVDRRNLPALKLYRRAGFTEAPDGSTDEELRMSRPLTPLRGTD